ncbi:MAG: hypothetical protein ACM3PP_07530, partial [Candidatus Saccharibacteria bacterium]
MIILRKLPVRMLAALVVCLSLLMLVTPVCAAEAPELPAPESVADSGNPSPNDNSSASTQVEPQSTPDQLEPVAVALEAADDTENDQKSNDQNDDESIKDQNHEPGGEDAAASNQNDALQSKEEDHSVQPTADLVPKTDVVTAVSDLPPNDTTQVPRVKPLPGISKVKSMSVQSLMSTSELLNSSPIQHTLSPGQSASDSISVKIPIAVRKTDILFVFDSTASTWYTNKTAAQDCINIINQLNQMGDVDYGVATFMDYTNTYTSYGYSAKYGGVFEGDYPYHLNQPITSDDNLVISSLNNLPCGSGGDPPEAYTRAIYESYADTSVSWRPNAKRIVILVGDSNPHDNNLYEGFSSTIWSLGGDPGRDEIMFTADDLDLQAVLQEMAANNTVLIHCRTASYYLSLWSHWTGITGGETIDASGGSVESALLSAITSRIGQDQVTNLHLVPSANESWITVDPSGYSSVALGSTKIFNVTFSIPPGTPPGTYNFNLSAVDDNGTNYGDTPVEITVPLAEMPTAQISYSPATSTNGSVTASLVNANKPIIVTNNGGSTAYTFNENGTFTFEFKDDLGYTGTATATVTWIDKEQPAASISYSTSELTNTTVTATLVNASEPITITNNGGANTYSFTNNGSFTFEFTDAAGNTGSATATVTWID